MKLLSHAIALGILSAIPVAAADSVVVFNEIHYHPADVGETLEFVELQNQMSIDIDISGWKLDGVGDYVVPQATTITAGGYIVIARNPAALETATGYAGALGPYAGALDNGGEPLTLRNHGGRLMDEIEYNDNAPWPVAADGSGATLSRIRPNTASDRSASWAAGQAPNGTPGAANITGPSAGYRNIAINEISGASDSPFFVELHNAGSSPVSLAGLIISNGTNLHTIASGTLPVDGHVAIDSTSLGFLPTIGDALFLLAPGGSSIIDGARVKATPVARADGEFHRPTATTPGTANDIHFEDRIVINEIFYHHAPVQPSRTPLFDLTGEWRYEQSGTDLGDAWRLPGFDDSAWPSGPGALGFESNPELNALIGTTMSRFIGGVPPIQPKTYYFRKTIQWNGPPASLILDLLVDDGAVVHLNGNEIHRTGMADGAVTYDTLATPGVGEATWTTVKLPAAFLTTGTNVLSVEVHQVSAGSSDMMFGIAASAEVPWSENDQEWIELHNLSTTDVVDLSGWTLNGPADFEFPSPSSIAPGGYLVLARDAAAFAIEYPSVPLAGAFSGKLSNGSGHLVLRDALGNTADDLRYYDGKPWPAAADGGGSSLELRNPRADNSKPEAWAASDETDKSAWKTYTIRGTATNHIAGAPTNFHEFQFGLLAGGGECLIDDVSIIEDPDGAAIQRVGNGNFSSSASGWRFRGNHQRSTVENGELHLRASGNSEYMGNQIETTFASGSIVEGATYEISFRAKWLSGSPMLNSRLYFDRLASVTFLETPSTPGTPGAANSTAVANIGPTCSELAHTPVVPAAGQSVTVSTAASDPDGIASMNLKYSVNGGAFSTILMSPGSDGRYSATIPGQAASAIVQFYIRAQDATGMIAEYPAGGAVSRALFKVDDGSASGIRQNVRIVMTTADSDHMHDATNVLSNERLPATIIYNESEVYYDIEGVRLKGSYVGRNVQRVGFNVAMNADQPFRGVHPKFAIDRSAGGSIADVSEMFLFKVYTKAADNLPSRYDDIIQCIAPRSAQTSVGHLRLAGFDGDYLDSVYDKGSDGDMFEFETLRWTTTTHNGLPTGLKIPGSGFAEVTVGNNLAGDKESYRAGYFLMNNRSRDDYSRIIAFNETMALSGAALAESIGDVIDLDQWARVFAVQSLMGHLDTYNRGIEHNIRFYVRPSDRRVLAMPWDWDFIFQQSNQSLAGDSGTFGKLLGIGSFRRAYYGHIRDLMAKSFNRTFMDPWIDHYGTVSGNSFASVKSFISNRTSNVNSQLGSAAPSVTFAITTNGGSNFSVAAASATIEGNGWIDIRNIAVNGLPLTEPPIWTDFDSWQIDVPLSPGANVINLTALDFDNAETGTDSITVTNTTLVYPASASNLVVSEIMYHPADGGGDEFIEIMNIGANDVDLTGVRFSDGIDYNFAANTTLDSGARLVISESEFLNATGLRNSGEQITLLAGDGSTIRDFSYSDDLPWPTSPDGDGPSLVLVNPLSDPDHTLAENWRSSTTSGGNPGTSDATTFGGGDLLDYALRGPAEVSMNGQNVTISYTQNLGADDATVQLQWSADLETWSTFNGEFALSAMTSDGAGHQTVRYDSVPGVFNPDTRFFVRLLVAVQAPE